MTSASQFQDYLKEQLQGLGGVSIRRMFGGAGIFRNGLMFALVADETLYFKVDDTTRARFEAEGATPFQYTKKGKQMSLAYWRAPEHLYDEPDEMIEWAREAFEVAMRADAAKPASARKHTAE